MIKTALDLAAKFHDNQFDKSNAPYIMHPIRVMLACSTQEECIVAILHDLIEDTPLTLEDIRLKGFSEEIITALDTLTKRPEEIYDDYIDRILTDALACRVKLADLCDNSDLTRIATPKKKDLRRLEKYQRAAKRIIKHLRAQNNGILTVQTPAGYHGERLKSFLNENNIE